MAPAGDEGSDTSSVHSNNETDDGRETLERGRQALGLSSKYVSSWKPRDAFREFFQNWKDAIIDRYKLDPRDFRLDITDDAGVYVAQARDPNTRKLLGFIRYKENEGTLALTNFDANLPRSALNLGESSKQDKSHQSGTHGEGFKVAALVIVRERYQARIETSNFYWRFFFGGRNKAFLYCGLTPLSEVKLEKQKRAYALKAGRPRELLNNIWEDVSVKIGRLQGPNWGQKIARQDFEEWVKVAIDLDNTAEIINTSHGSLILNERYGNKVFLKGLLLEGQSEGRKFKYGYDFVNGTVGRDRKTLENRSKEPTTLANIWGEAIAGKENDCLSKYVSMLWKQEEWADVMQAEKRMSGATAKAIWDYLRTETSSQNQFYYNDRDENGDRNVKLIRRSLKKEPVKLAACIWDPLRKFDYIRTPQEERHYLLYNAPVAVEKNTPFAFMVNKALLATLCLDMRTKNLELVFKDGTAAELDLLLDGNQIMINEKWLDFYASHENVPCWLSRLSATKGSVSDAFACDHIITDLYDMVLKEINKHNEGEGHIGVEPDGLLRLRLVENLRQMPRVIRTTSGYNPGEIDVNWMVFEGDAAAKLHRIDVKYRVTLHRKRTCSSKRSDLVTSNDVSDNEDSVGTSYTAECGCPEQLVLQKDSKTTFRYLDYDEEYFPIVSRNQAQAFYGVQLSPNGIQPKAPQMPSNRSTHTRKVYSSKPEIDNAPDDIYAVSSPGESGDTSIPDRAGDASTPDVASESLCSQSMPPSTVGAVPIRPRRSGSPPARLDLNKSWKLERNRELQGQLEGATRQLKDSEANFAILQNRLEEAAVIQSRTNEQMANITSERDALEATLEHQSRTFKGIEAENIAKRKSIEEKEQLLQIKGTELDATRSELHDARAKIKALESAVKQLEGDIKQQEGDIKQLKVDQFESFQLVSKVSNLAARLNNPGSRETRMKEEEERHASPSERNRKRARTGLHDSQYRNVAEDPILID